MEYVRTALAAFDNARPGGAGGQTCGHEVYRVTLSGFQVSAIRYALNEQVRLAHIARNRDGHEDHEEDMK